MFVLAVLFGAQAVSVFKSPVASLVIQEPEHFIDPVKTFDGVLSPIQHARPVSHMEFSRGPPAPVLPTPDELAAQSRGSQATATASGAVLSDIVKTAEVVERVAHTTYNEPVVQTQTTTTFTTTKDMIIAVAEKTEEIKHEAQDEVQELKEITTQVVQDEQKAEEGLGDESKVRKTENDLTTLIEQGKVRMDELQTGMSVSKVQLTKSNEGTVALKDEDHNQGEELVNTKERLQILYKRLDAAASTVGLKLNKAAKEMEGLYGWAFMATEQINQNTNFLHTSVRNMTSLDARMGRTIDAMIDVMGRFNDAAFKAKVHARRLKDRKEATEKDAELQLPEATSLYAALSK